MCVFVFSVAVRRHVVRLFDIFNNRHFQFLPKKLDSKTQWFFFGRGGGGKVRIGGLLGLNISETSQNPQFS